jgi:hypothetical protein
MRMFSRAPHAVFIQPKQTNNLTYRLNTNKRICTSSLSTAVAVDEDVFWLEVAA